MGSVSDIRRLSSIRSSTVTMDMTVNDSPLVNTTFSQSSTSHKTSLVSAYSNDHLDEFDLPSLPSTPSVSQSSSSLFSSLNSFPSPTTNPELFVGRTSSPMRHRGLPIRSCSRSASSSSSSFLSSSGSPSRPSSPMFVGTSTVPDTVNDAIASTLPPIIRPARRTPYYPPNSSRNIDHTRVYMTRGPHYVPNWTPLSSLPRHVQSRIQEKMCRFEAY
jgi:hypothetical protein